MRDQGSDQSESPVKAEPRLSKIWLALVLTYYFVILVAFGFPLDALAGITALPAIAWISLGLGFIGLARFKNWIRAGRFVLGCFLVTGFLTAEEFYIPLRQLSHGSSGSTIAYISLNCAGGDDRAAREAVSRGAEVVFLQESPSQKSLESLGKEFGYVAFWGVDGSILTKVPGKLDEVIKDQDFVAIRQGNRVFVSLRLRPPQFRLDYYSPDLWKSQSENLRNRRDQLREIMSRIDPLERNAGEYGSVVIAGDFNAVPSQIRASDFELHDLGSTHGVNWGGSAVNDYPLARIDRVWTNPDSVSHEFKGRVVTEKTKFSDHRMVIVYQ
jgi:hypothetical protein